MECMQWDGWVHIAQIGGKDTKKTADSELSAVKYYELCKNMFILFCKMFILAFLTTRNNNLTTRND